MNTVEIDEDRLVQEADAALASVPPVEGSAPIDAAPVESWAPVVEGCVPLMRLAVFPQWDLQDAECAEFAGALGQCLDQVFPGGVTGPYACWVRLVASCGLIVGARYMTLGKLPPLGPKRADTSKDDTRQANREEG